MEHHPILTVYSDETEVTYSDLHTNEQNEEYINIYFETPREGGFNSLLLRYPYDKNKIIRRGYSDEDVKRMFGYYHSVAKVAFALATGQKEL